MGNVCYSKIVFKWLKIIFKNDTRYMYKYMFVELYM